MRAGSGSGPTSSINTSPLSGVVGNSLQGVGNTVGFLEGGSDPVSSTNKSGIFRNEEERFRGDKKLGR